MSKPSCPFQKALVNAVREVDRIAESGQTISFDEPEGSPVDMDRRDHAKALECVFRGNHIVHGTFLVTLDKHGDRTRALEAALIALHRDWLNRIKAEIKTAEATPPPPIRIGNKE